MEYLFGILILLGALVFFHELGHFLVAKFFGVRVEVFSLGFGPKLVKKKVGETQYCLSVLPLGGYVKLYGEDPTQKLTGKDANRSFSNQPVWRRIAIAAAGPFANVVLAIVVLFIIEMAGLEPVVKGHVAKVIPHSQAWKLGLRSGDEIIEVNGHPLIRWQEDFLGRVGKSIGREVTLTVRRDHAPLNIPFTPEVEEQWNMFCEKPATGVLKGISVIGANASIGITRADSFAAKAGFETGDLVLSLNGVPVTYWYELKHYLSNIAQSELKFVVKRNEKTLDVLMKLPPEYFLLSSEQKEKFLGLHSYELFITQDVVPDSPAYKAGLQVNDRLVAMNNEELTSWDHLSQLVQVYGKDPGHFRLTYDRAGDLYIVQVFPTKVVQDHPCGVKEEKYQIGLLMNGQDMFVPPKTSFYQQKNPILAVWSAKKKSFLMAGAILKSIGKMLTGNIPLKAIGGPILIGKVAGDQLKEGIFPFLMLLAVISINLAVLNILPIPVLDGGHLLLFVCEAIRGKPLSERILEYANRTGLAFLLGLLILVFYNDISRYWVHILEFLKKISGLT
ncbi:MAG: RIP metalloprotease RseP [Deltaproteobacteria bacterium]|nr:RIP metalloprotease RseP [Deltaproteobacteria bacterium]